MARRLMTIKDAAKTLGISPRHVQSLIQEADCDKRSRWRHGREIINLSPRTALRRTLRINVDAVFSGQ
jgi:hypothetical protein